ncbi:P-II family nitrogen regulator [bacterium]|nr:P-II family nitrogen regulator [bacterium]
MKMILAIVRPEKAKEVEDGLKAAGFSSLTEISVRGRGKQQGIVIGGMKYEKLPKELLMITCQDSELDQITEIIIKQGRTGNIGDGKIFVINVEDVITIRAGEHGEKTL